MEIHQVHIATFGDHERILRGNRGGVVLVVAHAGVTAQPEPGLVFANQFSRPTWINQLLDADVGNMASRSIGDWGLRRRVARTRIETIEIRKAVSEIPARITQRRAG